MSPLVYGRKPDIQNPAYFFRSQQLFHFLFQNLFMTGTPGKIIPEE